MARVLIAGCGYVGTELACRLTIQGHDVWALRRSSGALPDGVSGIRADLTEPASLVALPAPLDVVFYTAAPAGHDEAAYRAVYLQGLGNLVRALERQPTPPRLIVTSSTAVYAQHSGEWVDEDSPTEPLRSGGRIVLEGERRAFASRLEVIVARLGGIYGPGRTQLIERASPRPLRT